MLDEIAGSAIEVSHYDAVIIDDSIRLTCLAWLGIVCDRNRADDDGDGDEDGAEMGVATISSFC